MNIDDVIEISTRIGAKRAEVAQQQAELGALEQQLRELVGARPASPPPAPNGAAPRKAAKGERLEQVVALDKEGLDAKQIAAKLGINVKVARIALWRARKAGRLPKAKRS